MSANSHNFLVLMADQLAAQWLSAYGHAGIDAPNLAALAAEAVVFDAAYCPSPLCAPSRAAMLCGRYASRIAVYDNAAELPATTPTLVHHLRGAGYRTVLAGKMHFVGPDQLHGFGERLTTDIYPASAEWVPDWGRPISDPLPWYHTMESVLTPARCVASMQSDYDDEVCFHAARALRDLARAGGDQPFLMVASFTSPHDPWEIPAPYWDRYDPARIALPAVPPPAPDRLDPHSRRLLAMCGADRVKLSEAQIRQARRGYYAAVSYLDARIGELLAILRATGLERSTTVVLTADHGEFLGERGLWYKMSFLEPSARVPLLVRPPGGGRQRRVSAPVSLLDLAPTLLELGGLEDDAIAAAEMDGMSLARLIDTEAAGAARPPVICEYHAEGVLAPAAMVRQGPLKLIVCETDPDLLFDLERDPLELVDLAADPRYADARARLRALIERQLNLPEIGERVRASQRDRRHVSRGLAQGVQPVWDYEPRVDASMQYVRTRADLYELQRRARMEAPEATSAGRPATSDADPIHG
jgi:choline-sulfatase